MSFTSERETAARQAREDLPDELRHCFEVFADATAASGTDRLAASLQDSGFFAASPSAAALPVLSGPGSFRYLRVASLLFVIGLLVQAWLASPSRRQIFAMVREMDGALVLQRAGRSFATNKLEKIQMGDQLHAGQSGCKLQLSKGRSVDLPPDARIQCMKTPWRSGLGLEITSGSVELQAGNTALVFLAGGQSYRLLGRCKLVQRSCCKGGKSDAVAFLLYQGGSVRGRGYLKGENPGKVMADVHCNSNAVEPFSGWLYCCPSCRK